MKAHFPKRKNIRLKEWDYSRPDAYFVTMCVKNRELLFGDVVDGKMVVNDWGMVVEKTWHDLPNHYVNIETDIHVVMPNHFHGIVSIIAAAPVGARFPRPFPVGVGFPDPPFTGGETPPQRKITLGQIVGYFKYQTTKYINALCNQPGKKIWQRGFYEHIIRDENNYWRITEYIANNPGAWEDDEENPARVIGPV